MMNFRHASALRQTQRPDWMVQRPIIQARQESGETIAVNPLSDNAVAKVWHIYEIKGLADAWVVQRAADLVLLAEQSLIKGISDIFRLQ